MHKVQGKNYLIKKIQGMSWIIPKEQSINNFCNYWNKQKKYLKEIELVRTMINL